VAPAEPLVKLVIEGVSVSDGKLTARFANPGNAHTRIQTLRVMADGKAIVEANGWYVLAGARREQSVEIPDDVCRNTRTLQLEAVNGGAPLRQDVPLAPSMCKGR
jgi:fimbrial chaperone protein